MSSHKAGIDTHAPDLTLAVIGSGIMGRGIAQISALAGIRTLVFDTNPETLNSAVAEVRKRFDELAAKGKVTPEQAAAAKENLTPISDLAGTRSCQVVVEAVKEDLEIKRSLFRNLEAFVSDSCILATNTSSLSVTAIQAGLKHPGRFGGLHFFNPVPLMKIAEVIPGLLSEPWVKTELTKLTKRCGHKAVTAKDFPGFIVNHAGRGYGTEALRVLGENIADERTIDMILKAAGFRMGPFELLDLIGLDISHTVMESIYHQFYQEPRYRPSPIAQLRMEAGLLGRKSGRGFYDYRAGSAATEQTEAPTLTDISRSVFWVAGSDQPEGRMVLDLIRKSGVNVETGSRPSDKAVCIVTPLGSDATNEAVRLGLDPKRTVAVDTVAPLEKHRTLMTTPATSPEALDQARALFAKDGGSVAVIRDSAGFVAQRVLAMIVNIGCDIAQQGIAEPADVDLAVTLGLGYPKGPLALGDSIGARKILTILEGLLSFYGDPRYRPSPWLKRRAALEMSLLTN